MLRILQKNFALSLLDRAREPPAGNPGGRPSLGQTTVRHLSQQCLRQPHRRARDPVPRVRTRRGRFFRALAGVFVELSPPRSPVLMFYGDEFATFIDTFPPASSVPYLGDVARLEAGRTHAYHAADAEPLSVDELAAFAPVPGSGCGWRSTPPSNSSPRPIRSSRSGRRTSSRAARHPFRSLLPRMRGCAAQSRGRGPAASPGRQRLSLPPRGPCQPSGRLSKEPLPPSRNSISSPI